MRAFDSIALLRYARARAGADSGSSLRPCTIVVDNTLWYSRVLRSAGDPSDVCTQVFLCALALSRLLARSLSLSSRPSAPRSLFSLCLFPGVCNRLEGVQKEMGKGD